MLARYKGDDTADNNCAFSCSKTKSQRAERLWREARAINGQRLLRNIALKGNVSSADKTKFLAMCNHGIEYGLPAAWPREDGVGFCTHTATMQVNQASHCSRR